jgi:hypothetical protein
MKISVEEVTMALWIPDLQHVTVSYRKRVNPDATDEEVENAVRTAFERKTRPSPASLPLEKREKGHLYYVFWHNRELFIAVFIESASGICCPKTILKDHMVNINEYVRKLY